MKALLIPEARMIFVSLGTDGAPTYRIETLDAGLSAGLVIAASSAAGMPSGSEGNAQPASGACASALPVSAPTRIVAENSVRSIFSPS
jgi:hypothetical protein